MLGNKPLDHARLGDFYLNDGSLVRADSELSAELADACIGIVFYAGRHETDRSDYTQPLTEGGPVLGSTVHGYVVSLADAVHEEGFMPFTFCNAAHPQSDLIRPGLDDVVTRDKHVSKYLGTVNDEWDFNGYYNCMAIMKHAQTDNECDHGYPVLTACLSFGTRTQKWEVKYKDDSNNKSYTTAVDAEGAFDWQKSLVAPGSSSGWYLPSAGQMYYLEGKVNKGPLTVEERDFLDGQCEKVRNATTREELKNHSCMRMPDALSCYATSTEWYVEEDGRAPYIMDVGYGLYLSYASKRFSYDAHPILTF